MKIRLPIALSLIVVILCIGTTLYQNKTNATRSNDASFSPLTNLLARSVPPSLASRFNTKSPKHAAAKTNLDSLKNTDWAGTVMAGLKQKSYYFDTATGGRASSINLKQHLKTDYDAEGFRLSPLRAQEEIENSKKQKKTTDGDWQLSLHIQGLYADGRLAGKPSVSACPQVADTEVNYRSDGMTVQYQNTEAGVRQNFIVEKAPTANAKELRVRMQVSKGWVVNKTNDREVRFAQHKHGALYTRLAYSDLTVWDATGKKLPAHMDVKGSELAIVVATNDAKYPVTIDPLTYGNIPAITLADPAGGTSDQFGHTVVSAGDVNGDGYSDVAVTGGTKLFIYQGSSTGLPGSAATPTTTLSILDQSSQALAINTVATGDVNGDGYSDLIVAAGGNAYVYQGSANGLPTTATTTLINSNFGGVATAGDLNGDGYSDVIVTGNTGFYIFQGSAAGLNTTPATTILNSNYSIGSIATAGDVNGDGYSDVIAGSSSLGLGGVAYLFLGSANGLSTTASTTLANPTATLGEGFGFSVASAGDVNGDGYCDLVVGAPSAASGGKAYVFMGAAAGLTTSPAVTLSGPYHSISDFNVGWSVASAGDINGDGYSDIIVGEQEYAIGSTNANGLACIFNGSAMGIVVTPTQILNDPPSSLNSSLRADIFSYSVASAGDINGDGYSDIIIGAPGSYGSRGQAYIYMGVPDNVGTAVSSTLNGAAAGDQFGISVASAGDVNGDGYSDVIVGANFASSSQGKAYLYLGSATGLSTTAAATLLDPTATTNDRFGISVASAGDVNGDGYSDVIVGAPGVSSNQGSAYVYYGNPGGLSTTPTVTISDPAATASDLFGRRVASAGDVNGDGYSDVIVGAPSTSSNHGAAYVYYGSLSGLPSSPSLTLSDPANGAADVFGNSVATAGDVNGDGYSDVLVYGGSKAYLYYGGSSGLSATAATSVASSGTVGSAGDVNGDGYSDVIIGVTGGANIYQGSANGLSTTAKNISVTLAVSAGDVNGDGYSDVIGNGSGSATIYKGSANGLSTTPTTTITYSLNLPTFGIIASAGDVNGDGYSDVIGGSSSSNEANIVSFNGGYGKQNNRLRLLEADLTTPLKASNSSATQFGIGLFVNPFPGATTARLVWETEANGAPFQSSTSITNYAGYTDAQTAYAAIPPGGIELRALVNKVGTATRVRVRLQYEKAVLPGGQVFGPWIYPQAYLTGARPYAALSGAPVPNASIVTSALAGTSYCAGASLQVAYVATGTYNSGNTFTAQLSDASGSFTNVTAIGSDSATASGSIQATLPANTAGGTGYRIRVVSTNPAVTGTDNGTNLTINSLPALTPGTSPQVCKGTASALLSYSTTQQTLTKYSIDYDAVAEAAGFTDVADADLPANQITLAIPSTAGVATYHATVTVKNATGCVSTPYSVTITVNGLPDAPTLSGSGQGSQTACSDGTTTQTLTASASAPAGSSLLWYTTQSGSVTTTTPTLTDTGTLTYWAASQNTATGCKSAARTPVTLTLQAAPAVYAVSGGGSYCAGGGGSGVTVTLSNSDLGVNYTLLNGGTPVVTKQGTGTSLSFLNVMDAGIYTIQAVNPTTSCSAVAMTGTASVGITARPTGSLSGGATYCSGSSTSTNLTITTTGTGPFTGTLSDGTPFSGNTSPVTVSVAPTATTAYTIATLSDARCTAQSTDLSGSATVTVNTRPTGSLSGGATYCSGVSTTTNLTLSVTGSGTISGRLSDGTSFSGTAPIINISVSPGNTTTYTIASLSDASCSAQPSDLTGSATVTVNPLPSAPLSGGDQVQCAQSTLQTLTATATGGTITWYDAATAGNVVTSPTLSNVGTVTYYAESFNGSCMSATRTPVTLTIHASPIVSFNGLGSSYCANASPVILTGSPAGGLFSGTGITGNTFDPSAAGAGGPYTIAYSYTDGYGCSNSSSLPVTVNAAPSTPVITVFDNCGSSTLSTTATGSLLWSTGATTSSIVANTADTYSVTQTVNGCTSAADTASASPKAIPAKPTISINGSTTFCSGSSVGVSAPDGNSSYLWSDNETTQSIMVTQGGSYSVQVTNGSGCTSVASDAILITVNAAPSTPLVSVVNNCGSSLLSTTATGSLLWSTGETTSSISVGTAGTYNVTQTVNGCISQQGSAMASPKPFPSTPAVTVVNRCGTSSLSTTASGSLLWNTGDITPSILVNTGGSYSVTQTVGGCTSQEGSGIAAPKAIPSTPAVTVANNCGSSLLSTNAGGSLLWSNGATTPSVTVTSGGSYNVTQTVNGCTSSAGAASASPSIIPAKPTISAGGATTFCSGSSVTLTAPAGYNSYNWSDGETTPSVTVTKSGSYSVQVTNGSGCTSVASDATGVTVNTAPSTPAVTVVNNCGSSTLSTTATGSLLWSTGATSSSIVVNAAGTYNITQTVNGCTSASGGGTAAPRTPPAKPVVTVVNTCGSSTLSTTATGSLLWSTGATTSSVTVSTAGTYTVTQTVNGCTSPQGSATAAPRALPSTPAVTVSNSCGTSRLSTTATGSLLWSTGARTSSITVTTAGTYTVTQTANGCTSLQGSGVAAPNSTPSVSVNNITVNSGSASCSALVALTSYVTVTGLRAPTVVYKIGNSTITSVYSFPVGTSKVSVTATNSCGSITKTFTVTVTDNVAPVIACKPNTGRTTTGSGYTVSGTEFDATATDNCATPLLAYSLSGATTAGYKVKNTSLAGAKLNVGATTITWKATDASGNTATCTTVVTVSKSTGTASYITGVLENKEALMDASDNAKAGAKLSVKVMPNPSTSRFTLLIESRSKEKCNLVVVDEVGRTIEEQNDISPNSNLQIGGSYHAGIYLAVVLQGNQKVTVRLMKGK